MREYKSGELYRQKGGCETMTNKQKSTYGIKSNKLVGREKEVGISYICLNHFFTVNTQQMDGLQTIRREVKKYIDKADEPTLKSVQALLSAGEKGDWMNELPPNVIDEIDEALKDLDAGNGTPHAEIAKKYPQWFTK